jgi:GNAT acetyltransferase-like protein
MSVTIRRAVLEADSDRMVKLFAAHLNSDYDQARFDWLYRDNPDGPGQAWLAVDSETGDLVGTAAAIPRRVMVGGQDRLAFAFSDFCVVPRFRVLGPALQLQQACFAPVTECDARFGYDFPSAGMTAIYRRLGIRPFAHISRFARPLRSSRRIRAFGLPSPVAVRMTGVADFLLVLTGPRRRRSDIEVASLHGACGPEFSFLDLNWSEQSAVRLRRSAEYLNWRFLANPFQHHEIFTARSGGTLLAYAVVASQPDTPTVVDLFGSGDRKVIETLLAGVTGQLRAQGAITLSITLLNTHPWAGFVRRLGFRPRESSPVVLYAPDASAMSQLTGSPWLLTWGDRDS